MDKYRAMTTFSFTAYFSVQLEKRNFPYNCGREKIINDLSDYFWKRDHEKAANLDISDFRLIVRKQSLFIIAAPCMCLTIVLLACSAFMLKEGRESHV